MAIYPGVTSSQDLKRQSYNKVPSLGTGIHATGNSKGCKVAQGNTSRVNFKNIRLTKSPNHTSRRRKHVIFRTHMVKSGSNDFGDWILELLTAFQSSVNYLRNQSHQFNSSRYWQCSWLVSVLFWDRCGEEGISHTESTLIPCLPYGALYISP